MAEGTTSGAGFSVRGATPDEFDDLWTFAEEFLTERGNLSAAQVERRRGDLRAFLSERGRAVLVAERSGEYIGCLAMSFAHGSKRGAMACLTWLYVDPTERRAGIGRALFGETTRRCRRAGAVVLQWYAEPDAIEFYRKMGAAIEDVPPSNTPLCELRLGDVAVP